MISELPLRPGVQIGGPEAAPALAVREPGREAADGHFRRMGRSAKFNAAAEPAPCRFDVYRVEEVSTSSTQFSGGDWRWRLCDSGGSVLVSAGGYRHEKGCRDAVAALMARAGNATFETVA